MLPVQTSLLRGRWQHQDPTWWTWGMWGGLYSGQQLEPHSLREPKQKTVPTSGGSPPRILGLSQNTPRAMDMVASLGAERPPVLQQDASLGLVPREPSPSPEHSIPGEKRLQAPPAIGRRPHGSPRAATCGSARNLGGIMKTGGLRWQDQP